jgi:predicted CopG family antitoxin
MAVKTITIDLAAYDALARRKRAGESFSDVIKAHFAVGGKGRDLLRAVRDEPVAEDTIRAVAKAVASRKRHRARIPAL